MTLPFGRILRVKRWLHSCPLLATNLERLEYHPTCRGHLAHGRVERGLIGLRRRVEAADLTNELESGVVELGIGRSVIGVPQPFDVPTHVKSHLSVVMSPPPSNEPRPTTGKGRPKIRPATRKSGWPM